MLEYGIEDAKVLLEKNLEAANKSLSQVEDDLSFIRDQTTTLEVSILLQSSRQEKYENTRNPSLYLFRFNLFYISLYWSCLLFDKRYC